MSATLDGAAAERLAKLCGLFSSNHDGERATAALKADQLIRSHGLRWADIIAVKSPAPAVSSVEEKIEFALRHGAALLDPWEEGFLRGIRDWSTSLTAKQLAKLDGIVAKVRKAAQ